MTLFHVLKYSVSCPPTEQELAALPGKIFEETSLKSMSGRVFSPHEMAETCNGLHKTSHENVVKKYIASIRTKLESYEE